MHVKLQKKRIQLKKIEFLKYTLFLASVIVFGYIAIENVWENEMKFDEKVKIFVAENETANLISFMQAITFLGSAQFLLLAYLAIIAYFIFRKNRIYALVVAFIGLGSLTLQIGFKLVFKRNRPLLPLFDPEFGYCFPSGHALSSFVFCSFFKLPY